jgi:hypothetical protein
MDWRGAFEMNLPPHDITRVLDEIARGDGHASEELLPLVYRELRRLAASKMAREAPGQTLQATALAAGCRGGGWSATAVEKPRALLWSSRGGDAAHLD